MIQETIKELRERYNEEVVYTNGLYHFYTDEHNEIYINNKTKELDKRCLYNTLVVMDEIIVAKTVNSKDFTYVILNKADLKLIYKTTGNIYYISDDIVCDRVKNKCTLLSSKGKVLGVFNNTICIFYVRDNKYVVKSNDMYNDKVLHYNKHRDVVIDLTKDKQYLIYKLNGYDNKVGVVTMTSGKYIYDFEKKEVTNQFTNNIEKSTQLWQIM